MNNAIIYVGKYSPILMGMQDTALKNKFNNLIFIDTGRIKSKISQGLCKEHHLILDPTESNNKIIELAKGYNHVYCLALSYNDILNLHKLSSISQNKNITIIGPSVDCIDVLQNKEKMNNAAQEAGLPILQDIDIKDKRISNHFPLVLRPTNENNADFKADFIHNSQSLAPYLTTDVVAQRFISGPNIVVHFANFSEDFNIACFAARNKYEGVTLTLEKSPMIDSILSNKIKTFLDNLKFKGIGHIEFIQDELTGELYFLDFNGRFGGTSLKAAALGFNEFYLTCSHFMPSLFKANIEGQAQLVSNPLALIKCIKTLCTSKKDILDYPQKNKLSYLFYLFYILMFKKNELRFPTYKIQKDYFYNLLKRKFN